MEQISFQVHLNEDFPQAVERVKEALKAEGFGVLTEVDVKATLKVKLDQDFRRYVILGACNPPLAHKALQNEPLVGLMLPCNVTVEDAKEGGSLVNFINPHAMVTGHPALAGNPALGEVATDAFTRLERAAQALAQS